MIDATFSKSKVTPSTSCALIHKSFTPLPPLTPFPSKKKQIYNFQDNIFFCVDLETVIWKWEICILWSSRWKTVWFSFWWIFFPEQSWIISVAKVAESEQKQLWKCCLWICIPPPLPRMWMHQIKQSFLENLEHQNYILLGIVSRALTSKKGLRVYFKETAGKLAERKSVFFSGGHQNVSQMCPIVT